MTAAASQPSGPAEAPATPEAREAGEAAAAAGASGAPGSPGDATGPAWSRYWQTGALHSCAGSFAGNYDGAIGAFWRAIFTGLAAGERVLDIAAGNGALARLLLDTCSAPTVSCDSIDLAPVSPPWLDSLPPTLRQRVRFHGQTQAEALPFADRTFTLAVSQYGLEYSSLDASIPELLRVLGRPSHFAAIVHHAGSRPVSLAAEESRHIAWALAPGGLLSSASSMLGPMARAATDAGRRALAADQAALAARDRFNACQRELTDRAARSPCPDLLFELRQAVAAAVETARTRGEAAAAAQLRQVEQAVRDDGARLADMQRSAKDAAALQGMLALFGAGASHQVDRLEHAGHLMGWAVRVDLR